MTRQWFTFSKDDISNKIDVAEKNMRPMAYMDAIGVIAELLEEHLKTMTVDCTCPDCERARELLLVLPRRKRI